MQIEELTKKILEFRNARNWSQFHTPKDMALSLLIECAELAEHFQWKTEQELPAHIEKNKSDIGDELSDVLYWVLLMANDMDIDLENAFLNKMKKNIEKYPVQKAQGKNLKYTEL